MSRKPYIREMSKTNWFFSQPRYMRYMAREVTCIFILAYTLLLIKRRKEELGLGDNQELSYEDMKEAIVKAGATRLRPVLLTAITTVLGLIPLAVGFNFNFFTLITDLDPQIFIGGDNTAIWGPMAWTVIYGLIFATFLTLIVVPVMFWLAYRLKQGVLKLFRGGGEKDDTSVSTV